MTVLQRRPAAEFGVHHWDKVEHRHVDTACGCLNDACTLLTAVRKTQDASAYLVTFAGDRWVMCPEGGGRR